VLDANGDPVQVPAGSKLGQHIISQQNAMLGAPSASVAANIATKMGIPPQAITDTGVHQGMGFVPGSGVDKSGHPYESKYLPISPGDEPTDIQVSPAGTDPKELRGRKQVFRDLPVRDPARVVQVQLLEGNDPTRVSYPLFRELAAHQQVLEGFFATSDYPVPTPQGAKGFMASGGYFRTLGVAARIGRVFTEDDNVPNRRLLIIDTRLAQKTFPGQSAVGKRLMARVADRLPAGQWLTISFVAMGICQMIYSQLYAIPLAFLFVHGSLSYRLRDLLVFAAITLVVSNIFENMKSLFESISELAESDSFEIHFKILGLG
jgi:hypothetical protein